MVLDKLSDSLKSILKKIARAGLVDKKLIGELIKEMQRALLNADVNVKLVFELTEKIKKRALNEKPPGAITQREYLIKIVYDELVNFLGEEKHGINTDKKKKPFKIILVGTFGNGKTTLAGKLANYYTKRGFKVATLGLDVHRPQAPQQLQQVTKQSRAMSFIDETNKNPIDIYNKFSNEYKKFDILIIDTAGRDSVDNTLIKEIKDLDKLITPNETLLVVGADLGQASQELAEAFNKNCNITGIVLTKLDGTAKGGGALSACAVSGAPIKFIGMGEKINDLEEFNPKGFVGRLLGMGDLEALLEKAKEAIDEEQTEELSSKMLEGDFNLVDLHEQMRTIKKLGPLNKVLELIPGMGNLPLPKEILEQQEDKIEKWKCIMESMTKKELENPEIIDSGRIERIATGSGTTTHEVRELLKQYKQAKKLIKTLKGEDPMRLMKKFKGKIPGF